MRAGGSGVGAGSQSWEEPWVLLETFLDSLSPLGIQRGGVGERVGWETPQAGTQATANGYPSPLPSSLTPILLTGDGKQVL